MSLFRFARCSLFSFFHSPMYMEYPSPVWPRTTKARYDIPSNIEYRTRYLPELPGEQSGWRRVGVAARYDPRQNMLKSDYRYILEEQQYNNGYRYRLKDNDQFGAKIAPIPVGWHQTKLHDYQVVKAHNFPEAPHLKSTKLQRQPLFFQVKLDLRVTPLADYRPDNPFGDLPMMDTRYRSSVLSVPVRKQV